jgi:hypothetical protein
MDIMRCGQSVTFRCAPTYAVQCHGFIENRTYVDGAHRLGSNDKNRYMFQSSTILLNRESEDPASSAVAIQHRDGFTQAVPGSSI